MEQLRKKDPGHLANTRVSVLPLFFFWLPKYFFFFGGKTGKKHPPPLGVDATGTRKRRFKTKTTTTTRRRKGKTTTGETHRKLKYIGDHIRNGILYHSLKLTCLPFLPKFGGWEITESFWGWPSFKGELLVPGRVFFLFSWLVRFLPTVILGED